MGFTLLHWAVKKENFELVKFLLEQVNSDAECTYHILDDLKY